MAKSHLQHDALFYGSDEEFVSRALGFLVDGLEVNDALLVVTSNHNTQLLREGLASEASRVTFEAAREWFRHPAETIANCHRVLSDRLEAGATRMRIIGETVFGPSPREHASWARYESALNHVFRDRPLWMICPHDLRVLPESVISKATRTHPHVIQGTRRKSDDFTPPENFLNQVPDPMPAIDGPPLFDEPLSQNLGVIRVSLRESAIKAGIPPPRSEDLVVAVVEVASNALRYGGEPGRVILWSGPEGVVAEVRDNGKGLDGQLAGYVPPEALPSGGMGLWLARRLSDGLWVVDGKGNTTIRIGIFR